MEQGRGGMDVFPTKLKSEHTRVKCMLIGLLLVALLVIIGLIIALVLVYNYGKDKKEEVAGPIATPTAGPTTTPEPVVCTSQDCVKTAARVIEAMDVSVDPCEDFYTFSCGNWQKSHVIPDDSVAVDRFNVLDDDVSLIIRNLLEDEEAFKDFEAVQKSKDFYSACSNLDKMEEIGASAAIPLLEELGGWPVLGSNPGGNWNPATFDLVKLLVTLNKYNNAPLIYLSVYGDLKDSTKQIIYIDQAGFGLPGRDYYLEDSLERMREAYVTFAIAVAELFGADPTTAATDMEDMMKLETDLANGLVYKSDKELFGGAMMTVLNFTMRAEDRRDWTLLYNRMTLDQMADNLTEPASSEAIQFSWTNFVESMFAMEGLNIDPPINGSEPVVVEAVPYLLQLFNVLRQYSPRTVSNYLVWRIMKNRVKNLSQRFRDVLKEYTKVISGSVSEPARWRFCTSYTNGAFSYAVGHMFVKETFNENAKNASLEMVKYIRESFDEILNELDWMDDQTRLLANQKADAIKAWIGYPEFVLDTNEVNAIYVNETVNRDDFFGNVINYLNRVSIAGLNSLRLEFNHSIWKGEPTVINAYYDRLRNSINFPAGILQIPFYSTTQPQSMNYGGIGMVIGHEITHGFDDQGRQFDKDGDLNFWWSDAIIDNFKSKTQCFIDQYGDFFVPEANLKINGINTQGENIADNGGIKQSYRAYRKWVEKQGKEEPPLPGLGFNHNQLFFINFAQIWCSNWRDNLFVYAIRTGVYSPPKYRVIGTLQNSPDFASAFNCPTTSYMRRQDKCVLW